MAKPAVEHIPWWKDPDFWKAFAVVLGIVVPQGFIGGVVGLMPQAFVIFAAYLAALATFVVLVGLMWFKGGQPWRKATLVLLIVGNSLFAGWAGAGIVLILLPPPPPPPTQVVVDRMDDLSEWLPSQDAVGQPPVLSLVPGMSDNAVEISYTLGTYDWVRIQRNVSSSTLAGTQGIGLWYEGTGAPNSIEIELIYAADKDGKTPTFQMIWNRATNAANWTTIESSYVSFACWTDTGCAQGEAVDPSRVAQIQIAVSNKQGADTPGAGSIVVDNIYAFP
jgi:hypothetical protein